MSTYWKPGLTSFGGLSAAHMRMLRMGQQQSIVSARNRGVFEVARWVSTELTVRLRFSSSACVHSQGGDGFQQAGACYLPFLHPYLTAAAIPQRSRAKAGSELILVYYCVVIAAVELHNHNHCKIRSGG